MTFSKEEREQILSWYENVSRDFMHYGDGTVLFPSEAILIERLSKSDPDEDFEGSDLNLIRDWMMKNIGRKYGDSVSLMGVELSLYQKFNVNSPTV